MLGFLLDAVLLKIRWGWPDLSLSPPSYHQWDHSAWSALGLAFLSAWAGCRLNAVGLWQSASWKFYFYSSSFLWIVFRGGFVCLFVCVFFAEFEREMCEGDSGFKKKISLGSWHPARVSERYVSADPFGSERKKVLIRSPNSPTSSQSNWDALWCTATREARPKQPKPPAFFCELGRSELHFLSCSL